MYKKIEEAKQLDKQLFKSFSALYGKWCHHRYKDLVELNERHISWSRLTYDYEDEANVCGYDQVRGWIGDHIKRGKKLLNDIEQNI